MILLYELPNNEKGNLVKAFLERIHKSYRVIDRTHGGCLIGDLIAGSDIAHPLTEGITDSAIFFDHEVVENDARHILDLLAQVGIQFRFQVLVNEEIAGKTVMTVLAEQAAYQEQLKKMKQLQELIDACGKLKKENYDPDCWSTMKYAIADANDALDAIVGEYSNDESEGVGKLDECIENLQNALNHMLTFKPSES